MFALAFAPVCMSGNATLCWPDCLPLRLSACLLFICLRFRLSACLPAYLPVFCLLIICLCVTRMCLCVTLSACTLSVCPSAPILSPGCIQFPKYAYLSCVSQELWELCMALCMGAPMRQCCACWSALARWRTSPNSLKASRTARRRCLASVTGT